jgi:hypothetical protein
LNRNRRQLASLPNLVTSAGLVLNATNDKTAGRFLVSFAQRFVEVDHHAQSRSFVIPRSYERLRRADRNSEDIQFSVDADHLTIHVEGRSSGVALVDWRIDLDLVFVSAAADFAACLS